MARRDRDGTAGYSSGVPPPADRARPRHGPERSSDRGTSLARLSGGCPREGSIRSGWLQEELRATRGGRADGRIVGYALDAKKAITRHSHGRTIWEWRQAAGFSRWSILNCALLRQSPRWHFSPVDVIWGWRCSRPGKTRWRPARARSGYASNATTRAGLPAWIWPTTGKESISSACVRFLERAEIGPTEGRPHSCFGLGFADASGLLPSHCYHGDGSSGRGGGTPSGRRRGHLSCNRRAAAPASLGPAENADSARRDPARGRVTRRRRR